MKNPNNPAGRLHALLLEGQKLPREKPAFENWMELLEVPEGDSGLLLRRIGYVMTLPSAVETEMSHVDDLDHGIYLKWLPRVVATFGILNFQLQWKQFIERFDGEIMYGLEICSDRLSREVPEKKADAKLMSTLLKKVNDMLTEVDAQGHTGSTWIFIRDHLVQIKEAIEDYKIRGIKPLEVAFENAVGAVVLKPELYEESQKTESGKQFWQIMGYLALVVTVTVGSIQIGKDIVSILPPPEIEEPALDKSKNGKSENDATKTSEEDSVKTTET